jgi:hypothetical protein
MLVSSSNLDYLITPLRFHVGDIDSTLFSDTILLTGLVNGVKMIANRWSSKYLIYASGIDVSCLGYVPSVNDVYRNCESTFNASSPPIVEQSDEIAIILAASILVRRSVITSSISAFSNWTTPDLSYSNVQSSKQITSMLEDDQKQLDLFFKGKLGKSLKGTFPIAQGEELLPLSNLYPTIVPYTVNDKGIS